MNSIRSLQTSDIRARRAGGRHQISSAGAHLIDGIPFGRSYLKHPRRPPISIPPRKRRRLLEEDDQEDNDWQDDEVPFASSPGQLRITAGFENSDDLFEDDDEDDEWNPSRNSESGLDNDLSSRLRSAKKGKVVQFKDGESRPENIRNGSLGAMESDSDDADFELDDCGSGEVASDTSSVSSPGSSSTSGSSSASSSSESSWNARSSNSSSGFEEDDSVTLSDHSPTNAKASVNATPSSSEVTAKKGSAPYQGTSKTHVRNKRRANKKNREWTKRIAREVQRRQEGATSVSYEPEEPQLKTRFQETISLWSNNAAQIPEFQNTIAQVAEGEASNEQIDALLTQSEDFVAQSKSESINKQSNSQIRPAQTLADDLEMRDALAKKKKNLLGALIASDAADRAPAIVRADGTAKLDSASEQQPLPGHDASQGSSLNATQDIQPPNQAPLNEEARIAVKDRSEPRQESEQRRSKLDISASRRFVFGSLGVRDPKNKEEEVKVQEKLGRKIVQLKKDPKQGSKKANQNTESVAPQHGPNTWRSQIDLKAVECCSKGVKLSTPPFPFVQRWDLQQSMQLQSKGRKRKRCGGHASLHAHEGWEYEEHPALNAVNAGNHEDQDNCIDQDDGLHSQQMLDFVQSSQVDTCEDVPAIPSNPSSLPSLEAEHCKTSMIIIFRRLECSAATCWAPQVSSFRTATINGVSMDGHPPVLHLTLAHRDRPVRGSPQYDHKGHRIYEKFEAPEELSDHDLDYESGNNGKIEVDFTELIEPRILLATTTSGSGQGVSCNTQNVVPNSVSQPQLNGFDQSQGSFASAIGNGTDGFRDDSQEYACSDKSKLLKGAASPQAAQLQESLASSAFSSVDGVPAKE